MTDHDRRTGDNWIARLARLWPILLSIAGLLSAYVVKGAKIDSTSELADRTASKVEIMTTAQAVQQALIMQMLDDQKDMKRDIKEILRRVR